VVALTFCRANEDTACGAVLISAVDQQTGDKGQDDQHEHQQKKQPSCREPVAVVSTPTMRRLAAVPTVLIVLVDRFPTLGTAWGRGLFGGHRDSPSTRRRSESEGLLAGHWSGADIGAPPFFKGIRPGPECRADQHDRPRSGRLSRPQRRIGSA
jgi:hypothetical protein